ncbi:MAG: DUF4347 domain-containing protein, partial [Desulfuromusa sp.]|nr:DUF4347 domain-containing protein [Desulfuromusa sp.]
MANKLAKRTAEILQYEELEQRLLFSADVIPGLDQVAAVDEQVLTADETPQPEPEVATPTVNGVIAESRWEVVFVNNNVADYELLIADLQGNDDNRILEVVVLDSDRDGIEQISDILADRTNLDAVHFITHGSDGQVNLGNSFLDLDSLESNHSTIQNWGTALNGDADLLIYGCNLASTTTGEQFIDTLAQLTGADVAASDDLTGHKSLGGDWELEYQAGVIDAQVAVSESLQATWMATLDPPLLNGADNLTTITEDQANNAGTLVSDLISGHIAGSSSGIAVIDVDDTNGTWQYNNGSWQDFSAVSDSNPQLLAASASVRFVPNPDWNGTVTNGITFRAWDHINLNNVDGSPFTIDDTNRVHITSPFDLSGAISADIDMHYVHGREAHDWVAIAASNDNGVNWVSLGGTDFGPADIEGTLIGRDLNLTGQVILRFTLMDGSIGPLTFSDIDITADVVSTAIASSSITVDPINDAPTVANSISDVEVLEDAPDTVINISMVFADVDIATNGDSLTYSVVSSNGTLVNATISGTNLTLDYGAGLWGDATVTVTATDTHGAEISDSFAVTVTQVNNPPTVETVIPAQSLVEDFADYEIDLTAAFEDIETTDNNLHFTVSGDNYIYVSIFDGIAYISNTANWNGTETLTFTATDEGSLSVSQDVIFTVTPVNDAPTGLPVITGSLIKEQTLSADTTGIDDADGLGAFSYQWLRDGSLTGVTASTYTLGDADVGTHISVRVNYTDLEGTAESVISIETDAVANIDNPTSFSGDL